MPVIGFSHYNLRAPQELMEQLRAFYCEVVGLAVGWRPPFRSQGYWLYAGEHDVLHLTLAGAEEERSTSASTTFDHAAFACDDPLEYESRLALRAIPYRRSAVPQTGQTQYFFKDPAGNGVELNFANSDE